MLASITMYLMICTICISIYQLWNISQNFLRSRCLTEVLWPWNSSVFDFTTSRLAAVLLAPFTVSVCSLQTLCRLSSLCTCWPAPSLSTFEYIWAIPETWLSSQMYVFWDPKSFLLDDVFISITLVFSCLIWHLISVLCLHPLLIILLLGIW